MIIDISQEITKCNVYPGDPIPKVNRVSKIEDGNLYNLSKISMCAHNGTHVDAPAHFIKDGKTIDQIPLDYFVGNCFVYTHKGNITKEDALDILKKIDNVDKLLIKGDATIIKESADVFKDSNLKLIGIESQSVGPINSPMEVHQILLGKEIVLLEGLNLKNVVDGIYFLCAQPLNFKGIEGSPCRAILIKN